MKYRADIDGLRAIAVLSVLLFHYGVTQLSGGFVGVDVFFVISGFLITKHLADDISIGGWWIVRFYDKRIRRIVPVLAVVLAASLAAGYFLLLPGDYATTSESAAYSAFGLGNLFFFWNTGYFDREAELQPLLHMWSLGVEEQFYFVWPILLAAVLWISRGKRMVIAIIISCAIVLGLGYSIHTVTVDPKAAFYLPLPRAWELGVGALLAFMPNVRNRVLSELMGVVGLVLIGGSVLILSGGEASPGLPMVPAIVGSALLIWPRSDSFVARFLSTAPMRFTGLISYSLYLWHWPLFVYFRHYANGEMPTPMEAVTLGVIAYGLSVITWRFVETPTRKWRLDKVAMITSGLAASSVVALVSVAIVSTGGFSERLSRQSAGLASLDVMWQWECPEQTKLDNFPMPFCTFGAPWETAKHHALLWGDSHAEHMAPLIQAADKTGETSYLLYTSCPGALGGTIKREWKEVPDFVQLCMDRRTDALKQMQEDPRLDRIVLASSWVALMDSISTSDEGNNLSKHDMLKKGLEELVELVGEKTKVLLIGVVPSVRGDPVPCFVSDVLGIPRKDCSELGRDIWLFKEQYHSALSATFDGIKSDHRNVFTLFPTESMCGNTECITTLNGEGLYRDSSHIRRNLSKETLAELADIIGLPKALEALNPDAETAEKTE